MGASLLPSLPDKDTSFNNSSKAVMASPSGSSSNRAWILQEKKRAAVLRRGGVAVLRRPVSTVQKRVKALKKLVPNGKDLDLDGLFQKTADYITCLETQVKLMQVMVKVLSDCN